MRLHALVMLALSGTAGCVVDVETSAIGKPCPCPSDLVCDAGSGVCAVAASEPPCTPRFEVQSFAAAWTAPESIRWQWEPLGEQAELSAYRVLLADDTAGFESDDVIVFDSTRNAELGGYYSEDENGLRVVDFTIADGLESDHEYVARIEATDSLGCVFTSEANARTRPAATEATWFFQDAASGYLAPCTLAPTSGCGTNGDACLQCTKDTACLKDPAPPKESGWDNLYLRTTPDFSAIPAEAVTSGQAFLELSIAIQSLTPTYYSELGLMMSTPECGQALPETCESYLDACCRDGHWFNLAGLHLRAGAEISYQKLELPLDAFTRTEPETSIALEDLLSGNVCGVRLGAQFRDATEVRLDDVAVRW